MALPLVTTGLLVIPNPFGGVRLLGGARSGQTNRRPQTDNRKTAGDITIYSVTGATVNTHTGPLSF